VDDKKLEDMKVKSIFDNIYEINVDPLTVTVLFFAALITNFMIFANLGDAGLGRLVATISNAIHHGIE